MYYPIFLDLSQTKCLIVGAGEVGLRKALGLHSAKAKEVLVIDKHGFNEGWQELTNVPSFKLQICDFQPEHMNNCGLVFACTTHKELNAHIAKLCAAQNILCNCVDAPLAGSFIVPAIAKARGYADNTLMAAISTEGASPAWSRVLRKELEDWLSPHAPMTILLGRLRPLVLALGNNSEHNRQIFRALVNSPLRTSLVHGDKERCAELLYEMLPKPLHANIAELLHDIV